MGDADDEPEYTLLNKRDAKVYKIPPLASADGHKAGDWQEAIWKGNLKIFAKGKTLSIKLLSTSGELFAQCIIPNGEQDNYCERVTDSSRYWVLKIVSGQRHAFIGFGFSDRNDAFDFNACLADFKSQFISRDEEIEVSEPLKDLSLKEGEKIKVNLPGGGTGRRRPEAGASSGGGFGGFAGLAPPPAAGGFTALAPPPSSGAAVGKAPAPAPAAAAAEDDFADFQSAFAQQAVAGS